MSVTLERSNSTGCVVVAVEVFLEGGNSGSRVVVAVEVVIERLEAGSGVEGACPVAVEGVNAKRTVEGTVVVPESSRAKGGVVLGDGYTDYKHGHDNRGEAKSKRVYWS